MNADQDQGVASGRQARLRLEISGAEPVFIALAPGRNTVGRSDANDIVLDDATISSAHCVLEVQDGDVVVTELGSTNGTFIDGEPAGPAAPLRPGQKLQLGQVELTFEWVPVPVPSATEADQNSQFVLTTPEPVRRQCAHHPEARPTWICSDCSQLLCAGCVKQIRLDAGRTVAICPDCQGLCERLAQKNRAEAQPTRFFSGLVAALGYPFNGSGLFMLLAAGVVYALLALPGAVASKAALPGLPMINPLNIALSAGAYGAFLLGLAIGVYVLAFLRDIVLTSAEGQDTVPGWPALDQERLRAVATQFLATCFVSFGLWTLGRIWIRPETPAGLFGLHALLAAGSLYFPMALLAVIIYDDLSALNPLLVLLSIVKVPLRYGTTCLFLGALLAGNWLLETGLRRWEVPLLGSAVTGFSTLYAAMAAMRMLGWFYFHTRDELDWS